MKINLTVNDVNADTDMTEGIIVFCSKFIKIFKLVIVVWYSFCILDVGELWKTSSEPPKKPKYGRKTYLKFSFIRNGESVFPKNLNNVIFTSRTSVKFKKSFMSHHKDPSHKVTIII